MLSGRFVFKADDRWLAVYGRIMMVSRTVLFNCEDALQMKAVAVLIQKASTYRSTIWLSRGQRKANAKSLLGVMSLGIEDASELEISAEGADEEEALEAIARYLQQPEF
jgi:phosphotransferase system HPr (HPr) family protein